MTTALYRTNGGEVVKISLTDQTFDQRDTDYWTVAADPAFPDGTELRPMMARARLEPWAMQRSWTAAAAGTQRSPK